MEFLEILYEEENKITNFFDRKTSIEARKTLITGCKKCGKTYLIFDYLSNFEAEEYLYFDLKDERINPLHVIKNLDKFVKKYPVKVLAIENYDFSFTLPEVEEIIITSYDAQAKLKGFETLMLYPLDFEEFISFDRKHFNIEHIFNIFANQGTFPQIVLDTEHDANKNLQDLLKLIIEDKTKFAIFKKLSELQSTKISLFQLYNQLKNNIKISKDKLYKSIEELENENLLFLVQKFNSPKANKKVLLADFTIKNALSLKKDFLKRFENIIFSELYKKSYEVFYTDELDFYIPSENLGIFCSPFTLKDTMQRRLKKNLSVFKSLQIKNIEIVSVGNEDEFSLDGLTCKIVPFWEWALQR